LDKIKRVGGELEEMEESKRGSEIRVKQKAGFIRNTDEPQRLRQATMGGYVS
jgi:hypothetical protein